MNTKISIIIPVYNAEKYLCECVDSILLQTFMDFELILVDDCSTDNSPNMCLNYKKHDERVKYFKLEKNSGSAKIPIDYGVGVSTGELISIIGNDDYLDKDTLKKLYSRYLETGADTVFLKMIFFDDATKNILGTIPKQEFNFSQIIDGKKAVILTINGWKIGCNGALYKRDLLLRRSTYKNQKIFYMNADEYDTREMILMSKNVAFTDADYYYRKHSEALTCKISYKLFEAIYADKFIVKLFQNYFAKDSYEYKLVVSVYLRHCLELSVKYEEFKKKLSYQDAKKAKEIIFNERKQLQFTDIVSSNITIYEKILLLIPDLMIKLFVQINKTKTAFIFFLKLILKKIGLFETLKKIKHNAKIN